MKREFSLVGVDGNAFAIMGYVTNAMKSCKKSQAEISAYLEDAKSSDYDHLLAVSVSMVDKLNAENESEHE